MKGLIVAFLLIIASVSNADMTVKGGAFLAREIAETKISHNSIEIYSDLENLNTITGNIRKINGAIRVSYGSSGISPYAFIRGNDSRFTIEGPRKKILFNIRNINNELRVYRGGLQVKQVLRLKRDGKYIKVYRNKGRGFPIAKLKIKNGVYSDGEIIGILLHTGILR